MEEVISKPLQEDAPSRMTFSVLRVPFLLEPDYPEDISAVETNRDRLVRKWGGKQGWERQKNQHDLKGRGLIAGIPYFNLDRYTSNTIASHRLVQYIGKTFGLDVSEALYDRLNVYYFVEGHSLNDKPKLASVASEELQKILLKKKNDHGGVLTTDDTNADDGSTTATTSITSPEAILSFLKSNEGRYEIDLALQTLRDLGIHSIPQFIIEGTTIVDGAADWTRFVEVFRQIERRGHVRRGPIFADILGVKDDVVMRGSYGSGKVEAATT